MEPQTQTALGVSPFRDDDAEDRRDRDLLSSVLAGDHDALDVLVRRHQRFLYNVCLRMLHNPAEVLDVSRAAFRQKLSRARRDLHTFMNEKCGLVNRANPCRCERKTRAYMRAGYVDPERLLFAHDQVTRVREVAYATLDQLVAHEGLCVDVYRDHPYYDVPDVAAKLRGIVESPDFRSTFRV